VLIIRVYLCAVSAVVGFFRLIRQLPRHSLFGCRILSAYPTTAS